MQTKKQKCNTKNKMDMEKEMYFKKLNERFDNRVDQLLKMDYKQLSGYGCFAKSEMSAKNHCGIAFATIYHCDDAYWNHVVLGKPWED